MTVTAPEPPAPAAAAERPAPRPAVLVASAAILIVSSLLLGLVFNLLLLSPLRHARDQQVAYAQLRADLAKAVAPIGSTSEGASLSLGVPMGIIRIPSVDMTEVFFNGTTSTVLMSGAGLQRDTVMPGQVGHSVIYGRSAAYSGPFADIESLLPGTAIVVVTGQGEHTYRVTAVRRGDERPPALAAGEGRLTLVTAGGAPFLPTGLVQVDAALESAAVPRYAPSIPTALMSPTERAMAGDSSAAVGLVLWAALLLVAAVTLVWMSLRWGRWQTWIVAVPVVTALGVAVTNHLVMLMPNLL